MTLHVLAPGMLTTVQDLGRSGFAASGVGGAGAMDDVSLRLANLLVGNDDNEAALEITLRGPRLRTDCDALIAVTGAEIEFRIDGEISPMWRTLFVKARSTIELGNVRAGARAYVAIRGGILVDKVLDSRSTDVNSALGPIPRALLAGDELPTIKYVGKTNVAPSWSLDPSPWFDDRADRPIGLVRGAHFGRLDAQSQSAIFSSEFRVGSRSNRVGYRLEGVPLRLSQPLELVSEGVVPGTLQLPPGGEPIALMCEAPTTGGYPRIGHIAAADRPHLAQRKPGDTVRFVEISLADAQTRYLRRERELQKLRLAVTERLRPWLS